MKIIETERLFLRPMSLLYAPSYQRYFSDPEVLRYLNGNIPRPYPDNGAQEFIKDHILKYQGVTLWNWGLFLKTDPDNLIGSIEIRRQDQSGNRGFWLAKHLWAQGYMSEAVRPVTAFAFNELGFTELFLESDMENRASERIKIAQGAAFLEEISCYRSDGRQISVRKRWRLTK